MSVDTVLSGKSGWLYLHASSSLKEISKVVAPKNKYEGQTPNKSSFIEQFYAVYSAEILQYRVFKGHKNGLVSVFSVLAKIQKFIILHCPNFAQNFLSNSCWRNLQPLSIGGQSLKKLLYPGFLQQWK